MLLTSLPVELYLGFRAVRASRVGGNMAITAKARSRTALVGSSALSAEEIADLLRSTSQKVKGGGASLLTTGIANLGATVNIVRDAGTSLTMSLTSGKQLVELCTFSAELSAGTDGRTNVRVGGLETYKTSQSKFLMLIPTGPKQIYGMAPYKKFLAALSVTIKAKDPSASLVVTQPEE